MHISRILLFIVLLSFDVLCDHSKRQISDSFEETNSIVDVAQLATRTHGTELLLLDNTYKDQKSYKFEDFFWTGSGDGPEEDLWTSQAPYTIYKTKTILSTILVESTPQTPNETKCTHNCHTTNIPDGIIDPTPVSDSDETNFNDDDDFFDADRQFWLLTVLKSDGKDPVITDLKNSLAKLYRTAFQRQQERHLGIINNNNVRAKRNSNKSQKNVNIYIHKVEKQKLNGKDKIEVLYHVAVGGKPVDAITAANDMHFVSDDEVRNELGYPFLIKAEPYLKPAEAQGLSQSRNTWIFIGVSILGLLIFLLVVAFLTLGLTKRKRRPPTASSIENKMHVFERGVGNKGFVSDEVKFSEESPTYINFKNRSSRPQSSLSSAASTSSGSLDISPLMSLGKKHTPKKILRPKAATNKTVPINIKSMPSEIFDSDSSSKDTPDTIYVGNFDPGVISPKSFLSMPSVKSFPRSSMPEPLNKVLEPVSVLHLDMPDEEDTGKPNLQNIGRYGSVGAVEDPGVIGPIVWNMHRQRMEHGVSVDEGMDDIKLPSNVSRMRKRFHDLLDDTFSLFGSRRNSPPLPEPAQSLSKPIEVKSRSATTNSKHSGESTNVSPKPRPRTATEVRKRPPETRDPRKAWASFAPSPLVRPLSAGVVSGPRVNVDQVLAEGRLPSNDPAISLIATIKSEIEKVSLPGSTADLRE